MKKQSTIVPHPGKLKKKNKIQGRKEREMFGKTVNLEDYEYMTPRDQKDATFRYFKWLDLNTINVNDPEFWNLGIRSDHEKMEERQEALGMAFEKEGWDTSYAPPCIGTDDKERDGRTRILELIAKDERYCPVAVYDYSDDSTRNTITNGLKSNWHPPANPAKMGDFMEAGIHLCSVGELEVSKAAIKDWLYADIEIEDWFTPRKVTQIANKIFQVASQGSSASVLLRRSRKDWEKWCGQKDEYSLSKGRILMGVDSETYSARAWCSHIVPALNTATDPVEIILYTNAYDPAVATRAIVDFEQQLETYYKAAIMLANNIVGDLIEIKPPRVGVGRPWKIIGAVPQKVAGHNLQAVKLIPISEY